MYCRVLLRDFSPFSQVACRTLCRNSLSCKIHTAARVRVVRSQRVKQLQNFCLRKKFNGIDVFIYRTTNICSLRPHPRPPPPTPPSGNLSADSPIDYDDSRENKSCSGRIEYYLKQVRTYAVGGTTLGADDDGVARGRSHATFDAD